MGLRKDPPVCEAVSRNNDVSGSHDVVDKMLGRVNDRQLHKLTALRQQTKSRV
jgi:hypothetical protein